MFTQLTSANFATTLKSTEAGVAIFYKKLCPHCKNMEKVLEKFSAQRQGISFYNIDIEEEADTAKAYGAERAPTIIVIKGGKVAATKAGLMNPKEMAALYDSAKA